MTKQSVIKLNQKLKRVEINHFEIESDIVFNYFDGLESSIRDDQLFKALYIGVLALMEDRFSAFLSKTQNELGTELESLKLLFDMKKEIFYKTSVKGLLAEEQIAAFLEEYLSGKNLKDSVSLTGNKKGKLPRNKTGDIICELENEIKISIECKFDKSIRLGDIASKDVFTRRTDTAWSQLLEAQANREARVSIIVFDVSLVDKSILDFGENVSFIPSIGFIAIIDSQKNDYKNLAIAYMLSRDIALNAKAVSFDEGVLSAILNRIIKSTSEIMRIKDLVEQNIVNNKNILKQIEKSMLMVEFSQAYLLKFLDEGTLSSEDLLDFYQGEDIKSKFALLEKDLDSI